MKEPGPIFVADLFPLLDSKLIYLLESLTDEEWHKPTICPQWSVKDIAAHLLDSNTRKLSIFRDNYLGDKPENINSYQDLVDFLNRLNADWVRAFKRISPRVLISLLRETGVELSELFKTLDPFKPSLFPVAWAGEQESQNWFDTAREYTEKWHHQQQIRLAVEKPGIMERPLYFPVLDTFMRALPHTYRDVDAEENTLLKFQIEGEAGGSWYLTRRGGSWKLVVEPEGSPAAEVFIDQEIAWRLFTKGIDKETAGKSMRITGNKDLGEIVLSMLAVMA